MERLSLVHLSAKKVKTKTSRLPFGVNNRLPSRASCTALRSRNVLRHPHTSSPLPGLGGSCSWSRPKSPAPSDIVPPPSTGPSLDQLRVSAVPLDLPVLCNLLLPWHTYVSVLHCINIKRAVLHHVFTLHFKALSTMAQRTHSAVAVTQVRAPLSIIQVPTVSPVERQVLVRVLYVSSTPLDFHQADGGLFVQTPQVIGDGPAGEVVAVGPEVKNLKVGDQVFGFAWRSNQERAAQEYITAPETLFGKLPDGFSLAAASTIGDPFVTAWHTITTNLGLSLPYPRPNDYTPPSSQAPILIWGGSGASGRFAIQILAHYGYTNVFATASKRHHASIEQLGARKVFDYNDPSVVDSILEAAGAPGVPLILDAIGSLQGSVRPIAKIAKRGAKVAILLPVVVDHGTEESAPNFEMDVGKVVDWSEGVEATGVRTHFY